MNEKMFTVFDSKVEAYMTPFFSQTMPSALRAFSDTVQNTEHPFHKHAEDYTLFELGIWNDTNGSFEIHKTPIPVAKAIEVLTKEIP